jgi:hypothetical protein
MSGSTLANTNSGSTVPDPGLKYQTEADASDSLCSWLVRRHAAADIGPLVSDFLAAATGLAPGAPSGGSGSRRAQRESDLFAERSSGGRDLDAGRR